jgi:hypothetical protein
VEFQPAPNGSVPANGSATATGEWPAVPPAPTPVKPPLHGVTLDPPLIRATVRTPHMQALGDDSPTVSMAIPRGPLPSGAAQEPPPPLPSPLLALRRVMRGEPGPEDVVWQSRFATVTAVVIFTVLVPITLPVWISLIRVAGTSAGPDVSSLVALSMLLMGAFLAGGAIWMIIMEMRTRARLLHVLSYGAPAGFGPLEESLVDLTQLGPAPGESNQPVTAPIPGPAGPSRNGQPGGGSWRTLGHLPAQVAVLGIAFALFLGAVVLSR